MTDGAAHGQRALHAAVDGRLRSHRECQQLADLLALHADLRADRRVGERARAVHGEAAIADLHRDVAGLDLRVSRERQRPLRATGDREIEILDTIVGGGPARPRLVGHDAVFDLHASAQGSGGADAAAPAAAAPRATRGPRLGVDAQRGEVPAAIRRLDQRDHGALENEVAELDAKEQERPETQTDDRLVEAQERPLAERRVLGHLQIFQDHRGERQDADGNVRELDGTPQALTDRRRDQRLDARCVDDTRDGDESDDEQDHDDPDDDQ